MLPQVTLAMLGRMQGFVRQGRRKSAYSAYAGDRERSMAEACASITRRTLPEGALDAWFE